MKVTDKLKEISTDGWLIIKYLNNADSAVTFTEVIHVVQGGITSTNWGYTVAQLVEALRYKQEGRGFDSRCVIAIFHWHNPSGRTMAQGLTQPLTEMSTRNISWGVKVAGA